MPITVDLKVVATDPGLKGATATNSGKPATLETGLVVQVPLAALGLAGENLFEKLLSAQGWQWAPPGTWTLRSPFRC